MRRKPRWDRIMEMLADGVPQIIIADKFKTDVETIAVYEMVRTKTDYRFGTESHDYPQFTHSKKPTANEVHIILTLHNQGYACRKIASEICRSEHLVERVLKKHFGDAWRVDDNFSKLREQDRLIEDKVLALYVPGKCGPAQIAKIIGSDRQTCRRIVNRKLLKERRRRAKEREKHD